MKNQKQSNSFSYAVDDSRNPLIQAAAYGGNKRKSSGSTGSSLVAQPKPVASLIAKPIDNSLIHKPEPTYEPSPLEAVGNLLDIPGSMARDALAGRSPFDQLATPTRSTNRTTGRDLLTKIGVNPHDDSMRAKVASFGAEVLLDPTTYVGFGVATKGGKALSKAGLLKGTNAANRLDDATRTTVKEVLDASEDPSAAMKAFELSGGKPEHLQSKIRHTIDFAGVDIGKGLAPVVDKVKDVAIEVPGMRHLRAAFSPKVLNAVTKAGQDIGEVRKSAMDDAIVDLNYRFADPIRNSDAAASKALLNDVAKQAEMSGLEMNRFKDFVDASDVTKALENSQHLTRASSMAHASHELLGTAAKADGSGVPMLDALKRLGLDTDHSKNSVSAWSGGRPIESLSIDEHLLNDASRFVSPYTQPEIISGVRKVIESFNRVLKINLTLPFPQWHAKNALSAAIQNVAGQASDLKNLPKDLVSVARLKTGKTVRGLSKDIPEYKQLGVSDAEATKMLQDEMYAHGVTTTQTAADAGKSANRLAGTNPLYEATKGPKPIAPTPIELGGKLANNIEDFNRITPYIGLRRQGYTPEMAAARVRELQVDYDNLTHFEQKYAKNIIPFWTFSSRMVPLLTKEIVQHPGGPTAQMVRLGSKSDRSSDKPEWMKGETSIPIGGKHIAGLGLMHEDSAKLIGSAVRGDAKELAKQVGSRITPLLKFPLEQLMGKDVHAGQPIEKLDPSIEKLLGLHVGPTMEHAAKNSPAARYLSEARKIQKKREKSAIQMLTGLKGLD